MAGLPELNGPLQIVVTDEEEKKEVSSRELLVDLTPPSDYVAITEVRYDPTGGRNRLSVRMRLRRPLPGPAVTANLIMPPLREGERPISPAR